MSDKVKITDYTIYQMITDKQEQLRVAVSGKFKVEIEKLLEEYGSLNNVPIDKTVRGIFLGELENVSDNNLQENDITINQLRNIKT